MLLRFWRNPHYNIELRSEFAYTGIFHGKEINRYRLLGFRAADPVIDAIFGVSGIPFDEQLSRPFFTYFHLYSEMDMGRHTAAVRNGLNRAEIILASRSSQESAETLKICVVFRLRVARREINPAAVHLPNLDESIPDRIAVRIEQPPAQVCHFTDRWRDRVINNQQIIIRIQREFVRIKWSFLHSSRSREFLCKGSANHQGGAGKCEASKEIAA